MKILVLDPSGNFEEGQGTTGWALFSDSLVPIAVGQIRAEDYDDKNNYLKAHVNLIEATVPERVVMEDFLLYPHKANSQSYSRMETPKLIGILEWECTKREIPITLQKASDVKSRWKDDVLLWKGVIFKAESGRFYSAGTQLSKHMRDAIRHGVHFISFNKEAK